MVIVLFLVLVIIVDVIGSNITLSSIGDNCTVGGIGGNCTLAGIGGICDTLNPSLHLHIFFINTVRITTE